MKTLHTRRCTQVHSNRQNYGPDAPRRQRGAVLIVSLMLLTVMAILSLTGTQVSALEERMTGNMRDRSIAFQMAETALRAGEAYLANTVALPVFTANTAGLYVPTATAPERWDAINWGDSNAVIAYSPDAMDESMAAHTMAALPTYMIEEMAPVAAPGESLEAAMASEARFYRVTARGVGGSGTAIVMVQSTYKR